jgi:DNA-binding cell septation regulator SpoVG
MSTSSPFKVSVRLINGNTSLIGKADVTGKTMTINGFSIMAGKDGKPNWVTEPASKVGQNFVKVVEIFDKPTKDAISKAVLEAYQKAMSDRSENPGGADEAAF